MVKVIHINVNTVITVKAVIQKFRSKIKAQRSNLSLKLKDFSKYSFEFLV